MAYKIDTQYAIDPSSQQPWTVKSLDFLQAGNKDQVRMICRYMVRQAGYTYSSAVPYQLVNNGGAGRFVFFDDELYFMQAPAGGNNVATLLIQNGSADPLLFSDNVNHNVHNIRVIDPITGTLGSGMFDLADLVDIYVINWQAVTLASGYSTFQDPLECYKINETVRFRGNVTVTPGTVGKIGDVPAAFYPSSQRLIPCTTYNGTAYIANLLSVNTAGEIFILITTGTSVFVYCDGLTYTV